MEYHDKNGAILQAGDLIRWPDGRIQKLALTTAGGLGTDATNLVWVENEWAAPFEFGIYPLTAADMAEIVKVDTPESK